MKKRLLQFILILLTLSPALCQTFNPDFQPYITRPGDIQQLETLPDGRFLAAGSFSLVNDIPESNIARFFADGTLDLTFVSTINFTVTALAVQPDGKVIIGGAYSEAGAPEGITVIRLNQDGSVDNTFQAGFAPDGRIEDIEVEFNGTVLVAGAFNTFDGQAAQGLARLAPEGFLLQTIFLEDTGTVFISDIIVLNNGRFYVAGSYGEEGYLSFRRYSGLPADGFDFSPSFPPGINNIIVGVRDIELDSQGRIVMTVGTFLIRYAVVIINTDGSMADWGYVYGIPMDLAVDSFDNILVAGEYEGVNAVHRFIPGQDLIIYSGGTGCDGLIRQLVVHPSGSYLIGGAFSNFNQQTALSLERLDGFGNPFSTFNPTIERPGVVRTTTIYDDKIYIGGDFAMIGDHYSPNLARLELATGGADITFSNPGLSYRNIINHLALDTQNRILLAGTNENDGDSPGESLLLRVLENGTIDNSFNLNPLPVGTANKVIPIPGGLVMVVGDLTIFDPDIIASQAVLFTSNGTQVSSFSNRLEADKVTSAFRQSDGHLILAGKAISYDNSSPQYLIRLTPAFDLDISFQPDASIACEDNCRYTFHQLNDNSVLLGGKVLSDTGNGLFKMNEDGSLDTDFVVTNEFSSLDGFADGAPRKIESFPDGSLLVVGVFDSLDAQPSSGIAHFASDGSLINAFPDLSFDRQLILDALVSDQNSFILAGLMANVAQNDYRSVAVVDITPPIVSTISGRLQAWWGAFINNAEIGMIGTNTGNTLSDTEGQYTFSNVTEGGIYELIPNLNSDPLNGVSTLDLILISRHILGVQYLTTPYQILAADVNKSNSITILDMVGVRKVILGLEPTFTNNNSWRFVRSDHVFSQPGNPWATPFEESHIINGLVPPGVNNADFRGMKIGDVNGDADTGNLQEIEERQSWQISTPDQVFTAGAIVEIPITTAVVKDLLGFQFSITFDEAIFDFISIDHGLTTADNFGLSYADQGLITVSWNTMETTPASEQATELFTLKLKSRQAGQLPGLIDINSSLTKAEAYFDTWTIRQPILSFSNSAAAQFTALDAYPNPFATHTHLPFSISDAATVKLFCYNSQGQLLLEKSNFFQKGYNEWTLKRSELQAGLIYYSIEFGEEQYNGVLTVE